MTKRALWSVALVLLAMAMWPTTGHAADAVLYDVTETVQLKDIAKFRSALATLSGTVRSGTAICPRAADPVACTVVVRAQGGADDASGVGPVSGTFDVVIQDQNAVDGPELVIMRGQISGTIDLSPAFLHQRPWGFINAKFQASGANDTAYESYSTDGSFTGTFRLPFEANGTPSYLMDNGSIVPVAATEYALGHPTVRLELTFTRPRR